MAGPLLPPGPPKTRNISLAHLRNLQAYVRDPLAFVGDRFATYGDVYLVRTGGELLYVFKRPDHIAEVLVRQADAFEKRDFGLERFLGRGLLTSDGELWKQRRRMIQPGFSKARIEHYGMAMVEEAQRAIASWRDGQRLDMSRAMMNLTLGIVARTLFSHRIAGEGDEVGGAMALFQESFGTFDPLPLWIPTPKHLRLRKAVARMDALMFRVVDERREARRRGVEGEGDLLDGLLDAVDEEGDGGGLDRQALRDELVTLYLAGHDTTSHALSWAALLLSRHPEIDAKLLAELREVLGEAPATVADLERLPYLKAVCHEVLRLYPPAYVVTRRAVREVTIGEWTLAAGSPVVTWIYHTHHDPRWWPEPERFDPGRFLPDAGGHVDERPKLAWLPFGAGARMCIGKHFALLEMQLVLATVLRGFRFELDDVEVRPRPRITLTPAGGMPGVLHRR
ncbi:MAG: cytochrome P450 [Myxococcales bacterium]|nr:cytochrome P450 [Myxococcales bacterium]